MGILLRLGAAIGRLSLISRFIVALTLILFLLLLALGVWINRYATIGILESTSQYGARYLQSSLEPRVQSLASGGELSEADTDALQSFAENFVDGKSFAAMKIWLPNGEIIFASLGDTANEHAPDEIEAALKGQIVGRVSDPDDEEHESERGLGIRTYELYAPLRSETTGDIIAIGEFYQNADLITASIYSSAVQNWSSFAVAGTTALAVLIAIVLSGSRLIDRQRREQSALAEANLQLVERINVAQQNASEIDGRVQKRLGLELHDGPCQLLGYLLLSIDRAEEKIRAAGPGDLKDALEVIENVRDSAAQAMTEVRNVSRGLTAPHLDGLKTLRGMLRSVIEMHERTTGVTVPLAFDAPDVEMPQASLAALGRIVQEALTNAWKHAPGANVSIRAMTEADRVTVLIEDDGPGLPENVYDKLIEGKQLGLRGMLFRAESMGGTFDISSRRPQGTSISVTFRIPDVNNN